MGPDSHTIAAYVGDRDEEADRSVPNIWLFVACGNFPGRAGESRSYIGGVSFAFRWRAPFVRTERFREVIAAREPGPFGPLGRGGHGTSRTDGLPLIWRDDRDEIFRLYDFGGRELRFVERADRNQGRAQRGGPHHASMQHPGQGHVAAPTRFAGDFVGNAGDGIGRSDNPELVHRLHRRVACYGETVERRDANPFGWVGLGGLTCDRNLQIKLLTLNELTITDAFSVAGDDSVNHCKAGSRNTEMDCSHGPQGLIGVSSHFADIAPSA